MSPLCAPCAVSVLVLMSVLPVLFCLRGYLLCIVYRFTILCIVYCIAYSLYTLLVFVDVQRFDPEERRFINKIPYPYPYPYSTLLESSRFFNISLNKQFSLKGQSTPDKS